MNRNLFVFSLLLVLVGFGIGFYFISFIGLLLMIPSLLSTSRPPARPVPQESQPRQVPRRISPPPFPQQRPTAPPVQTRVEVAMASPAPAVRPSPMASPSPMSSSTASFSAALFPSPIIPTLNPIVMGPQPAKDNAPQKQVERDELVEVGTILALLKLALG